MKFKSSVKVKYSKEQVWNFLKDPVNMEKWDKNISKVIITSANPIGVGYAFDTISTEQPGQKKGLRMSYRIIEYVPFHHSKILLTRSALFKSAVWTIIIEQFNTETKVSCEVNLTFKVKYLYLIPLLLFTKRGKLLTDLENFETAMERSI